ncbi:hypothetical protein BGX34_006683 [Mortierella sp. NVP85]|nr:hypothetical protein BGX34_006683 [Mortierella sp. NVP85]
MVLKSNVELAYLLFMFPVLFTNIYGIIGHEIALYILHHRNGIYHWNQVAIANLPRDRRDKGKVEGCLELMLTLKGRHGRIRKDPQSKARSDCSANAPHTNKTTNVRGPQAALGVRVWALCAVIPFGVM